MTWLLLIALVATVWLVQANPEGTANAASTYQATVPTPASPAFGLAFVNAAENLSSPERIRRGIEAGAQMDRFPLYWDRIETGYAQFDWTAQDAALRANEAAGLATLAVLLGTPGHYYPRGRTQTEIAHPILGGSFVRYAGQVTAQSGCQLGQGPPAPAGLFNPIFVDGSDHPTPGKAVNPDNYWARFVHAAVNRYRAGGSAGLHVRHWEIWNEPDLCHFWSGTPQEYARLLKVAYLVIKQSDPKATVLWGGLAHFANEQFLYSLIDELKRDPLAAAHNGFFDAAASHHYAIAWHSFLYTDRLRRALDTAGWAGKPIWITESGVPVCDDYPGPPCPSDWRARPLEQAAYIWQNVAYTRLGGGGPIFHFMLHDDCGNIVAVDSPDGFGLAKNEASSFCSPANAEQRPAYTAYQLATQYFPNTELLWADVHQNWTVRRVAFYHPETTERRLLTWSIVGSDVVATLPATSAEARLLALDGSQTLLRPTDGIYTLTLPAATNHNWPNGSGGYDIGIYGAPYLLIEKDTLPPDTAIEPLPVYAPPTFPVTWRAEDLGSGVASVALWFRVEGGEWQRWQTDQPATGTLSFTGEIGRQYQFAALATDRAGNALTSPAVQAETEVLDQVEVTGHVIDPRGAPVAGVEVNIASVLTETNELGAFVLTVPIGNWDIRVAGQPVHRARSFAASAQLLLLYSPRPNGVENGDFEAGFEGWQSGGSSPLAVERQVNTGDHALRLATAFVPGSGVPGEEGSEGSNSTLTQQLSIPTGHPYLAFAYKMESAEVEAGHDRFEVILAVADSPPDYVYIQETGSDWRYQFIDLGQYAGQEASLIFNVYQSSPHRPTSVLLDVVTLSDTGIPQQPPSHFLYAPFISR